MHIVPAAFTMTLQNYIYKSIYFFVKLYFYLLFVNCKVMKLGGIYYKEVISITLKSVNQSSEQRPGIIILYNVEVHENGRY
jgi:hypothetical protein